MTEYTTSPEAIAQYMTSRERTMHWVKNHVPSQAQFYSPSVPPAKLHDPDSHEHLSFRGEAESDAESVVSLPPRMVLKYPNGRADIPISHWHYDNNSNRRSKNRPRVPEPRSRRHDNRRAQSLSDPPDSTTSHHSNPDGQRRLRISSLPVPEEIRILPPSSRSQAQAQAMSQTRSNSQSEDSHSTRQEGRRSSAGRQSVRHGPLNQPAPPITHSQSQPMPPRSGQSFRESGSRAPPAIVYAPSQRSGTNYAPPAIMHSSKYSFNSQRAPGVTYSHSAPVPLPSQKSNFMHAGGTPYPSVHGTQLSSVREEGKRGRQNSNWPMESAVLIDDKDLESHDSGSTYYVLPTHGQKIQVITAPEGSIYTSTSTTKSPTSPHSSSPKKPFFSRIFSRLASPEPRARAPNRLHRRHSTDGTGKRQRKPA